MTSAGHQMASINRRGKRWFAQVNKRGTRKSASFDTKAAAQQWATRTEAQLEQHRSTGVQSVGALTLADLIDRYKADIGPLKQWGRSKDATLRKLHADLGNVRVRSMTPDVLIGYAKHRTEVEGAGPVTVGAEIGYIGTVLRIARSVWRLDVPTDVVSDAQEALRLIGLTGKSKQRDRRVTNDEIAAVKAEWRGNIPTTCIDFAVATSMRVSEQCSVLWNDINTADRTVMIRDRKHPSEKLGNNQTVPLLGVSWDIVQSLPRTDARIWPFPKNTMTTAWQRAVRRAFPDSDDLPRWHDLRHEGISRLFEQGYRIEQVALVSGHRDWTMLRRYTQLQARDLHRASD